MEAMEAFLRRVEGRIGYALSVLKDSQDANHLEDDAEARFNYAIRLIEEVRAQVQRYTNRLQDDAEARSNYAIRLIEDVQAQVQRLQDKSAELQAQVQRLQGRPMKAMKAIKVMKWLAMKPMKAMKSMKAMKGTRAKIAKGKRARASVFAGGTEKTKYGLTKAKLVKNQAGKIVSKATSAATKKRYAGSKAQMWVKACSSARKELNIKGFVPCGGKTAAGKALLAKASEIYNNTVAVVSVASRLRNPPTPLEGVTRL